MTSYRQIVTTLLFFQFLADLEQFGNRIPDAQSVKLTFLLTVTFYLTNNEKELKNLLHSSHTIALKLHMCVNLRTKFQDFNIILKSFRLGSILPLFPPTTTTTTTSKQAPRKPTQIRDILRKITGREPILVEHQKELSPKIRSDH